MPLRFRHETITESRVLMASINTRLSSALFTRRLPSSSSSRLTPRIIQLHNHQQHTKPTPTFKMPSQTPIPLATLGANTAFAKDIQTILLPEYDRPFFPPPPTPPKHTSLTPASSCTHLHHPPHRHLRAPRPLRGRPGPGPGLRPGEQRFAARGREEGAARHHLWRRVWRRGRRQCHGGCPGRG